MLDVAAILVEVFEIDDSDVMRVQNPTDYCRSYTIRCREGSVRQVQVNVPVAKGRGGHALWGEVDPSSLMSVEVALHGDGVRRDEFHDRDELVAFLSLHCQDPPQPEPAPATKPNADIQWKTLPKAMGTSVATPEAKVLLRVMRDGRRKWTFALVIGSEAFDPIDCKMRDGFDTEREAKDHAEAAYRQKKIDEHDPVEIDDLVDALLD